MRRFQIADEPFRFYLPEPAALKHFPALRVEGIHVCRGLRNPLFFCKTQHFPDTAPADAAVLPGFADDDCKLAVVAQRHIADRLAPVYDIEAIAVRAEKRVHRLEPFGGIDMVDVVDLLAHIRILIPRKRDRRIRVIRDERNVRVNEAFFHSYRSSGWGAKENPQKISGKEYIAKPWTSQPCIRRKTKKDRAARSRNCTAQEGEEVRCCPRSESDQQTPCASMASATFWKPAIFAPARKLSGIPYSSAAEAICS